MAEQLLTWLNITIILELVICGFLNNNRFNTHMKTGIKKNLKKKKKAATYLQILTLLFLSIPCVRPSIISI
jgi:hypothetical protein